MVPTPARPTRRYGLGAVGWHSGEAVVTTRRRKRRREVAELLEALLARHPRGTVHVAWDNAGTRYRREVTHCELFGSIDALLGATREFFDRMNRTPGRTRAIIGAHPA
ncbi:MAG: hypothetical protein K0S81_4125 [Rhodospirillales bacterium]|nr:hypothetical protein [Rhodospirillales bacterium]